MATITKEIVESVHKYSAKFPNMTIKELGKLCGIAPSSVSNILNGMYQENEKKIKAEITHEEYKRLVACELAIDEMIANSMRPNNTEEEALFLSYRKYSEIIRRYFPDKFDEKVKAVQSEV